MALIRQPNYNPLTGAGVGEMNPRISVYCSPLYLLLLTLPLCLRSASAQSSSPTRPASLVPAPRANKARPKKPVEPVDAFPAPPWPPADVDDFVPPVSPSPPCSLPQVLTRAGRRVEQLVRDLDRFSATETVRHQKVDKAGRLSEPETSRFDYLVLLSQRPSGSLNVEEYRIGRGERDEFPDHVATKGTPSLVLIFHPRYVSNFSMTCEGLGEWRGKPAWQVRFEQRDIRQAMIAIVMGKRAYNLRIHGRAWILADSYEVARLETDLAETVPTIRLRLDHQSVEYGPVHFPKSKVEIWLPSSTELFMDFRGHRFYRRHTFTDFNLFSVKIDQQLGDPRSENGQSSVAASQPDR